MIYGFKLATDVTDLRVGGMLKEAEEEVTRKVKVRKRSPCITEMYMQMNSFGLLGFRWICSTGFVEMTNHVIIVFCREPVSDQEKREAQRLNKR